VVFNGALKSPDGLTGRSSIVEDGVMVQLLPNSLEALKQVPSLFTLSRLFESQSNFCFGDCLTMVYRRKGLSFSCVCVRACVLEMIQFFSRFLAFAGHDSHGGLRRVVR